MMSIHDENRFEDTGSPSQPQGPRESQLSAIEKVEVTSFAYDPQTYEILCRPGQPLSQKKARRLQELKLYSQVIRLVESHSP